MLDILKTCGPELMSLRVPSRGSDQFNLRLPEGMRDQIAFEAEKAGRSMNAEIVHRLAKSLDGELPDDIAHYLFESQRRLMFHVLNYAEEIPVELAVWAYDLMETSQDAELAHVQISENLPREEAITKIRKLREERRESVMAEIRRRQNAAKRKEK